MTHDDAVAVLGAMARRVAVTTRTKLRECQRLQRTLTAEAMQERLAVHVREYERELRLYDEALAALGAQR